MPRLKMAIPEIDSVYFWRPECQDVLTFGDEKIVALDYEAELPRYLGKQVKCEDCGELLQIPTNLQFQITGDPE